MASSLTTVTVSVKVAWWLRPYICTLVCFCWATGAHPDWAKLERVIARAVKLQLQVV